MKDILLEILNIEDSHDGKGALAISEQINYNYDESDDCSDDTTGGESEEELGDEVSVNFNNDLVNLADNIGAYIIIHYFKLRWLRHHPEQHLDYLK